MFGLLVALERGRGVGRQLVWRARTAPGRRTWPPSPPPAWRSRAARTRRSRPSGAACPAAAALKLVDRAPRWRTGCRRAIAVVFRPPGSAAVADAQHLRVLRPAVAARVSASSADGRAGTSPPSVSRIGARSGSAKSTRGRDAACQSSASTSATAPAGSRRSAPGNTAWATAAASATASAPPTRVVFLVAKVGKPSRWAAFGLGALLADLGACRWRAADSPPQPRRTTRSSADEDERGGMGRRPSRARASSTERSASWFTH